ncbi:hypothetical protein L1049_006070 [Liquidambar formosana]|uniref:WRKY domain-containing protein n=1 Tax=Liquidambar formosana TaxID=63359 RepID=A0AAP0WSS8_LIQFO
MLPLRLYLVVLITKLFIRRTYQCIHLVRCTMKEASDVCVSMIPRWDFKVHEAAQSSFRHAHHLVSCISDQNQARSIQEVSLIAQDAVTEFRKLLSLLDESIPTDCKRIRKGPLPNLHDINPLEFMENSISPPHSFRCNSVQPHGLQSGGHSTTVLIPSNSFNLLKEKQILAMQHNYSENNMVIMSNLMMGLNYPSQQSCNSFISMDGDSTHKPKIHYPSSEVLASQNVSSISMFSSKRKCEGKSEEASMRCVASTGGCHCSKRRKLRIKRTIKLPSIGNKLAGIPPDDFSWRKYGQKPIKGSPHPRYTMYVCPFNHRLQIFFN